MARRSVEGHRWSVFDCWRLGEPMLRARNLFPISDQPVCPGLDRSDDDVTSLDFERRIRAVVRLLARQAARDLFDEGDASSQFVETNFND